MMHLQLECSEGGVVRVLWHWCSRIISIATIANENDLGMLNLQKQNLREFPEIFPTKRDRNLSLHTHEGNHRAHYRVARTRNPRSLISVVILHLSWK